MSEKYEKTISVPLEKTMWMALRKIAYEQQLSLNELTRMGIEKIITKYEKKS
jgi:predicted DNA-binding ribbon-helix-helix protein